MQILQSLLGYFYPYKCMLCRRILTSLDELYICRMCHHNLKDNGSQLLNYHQTKKSDSRLVLDYKAQFIQSNLEISETKEADYNALEYMPKQIVSLFPYEAEYRKSILRWKYRGYRKYAKGFAKLLVEERLGEHHLDTVLIPIPLAPSRMKTRGYNQALDLAIEISKLTGIAVLNCLRRTHDTKPQVCCNREERYRNVYESMCYIETKNSRKIKYIWLIDDIYTTGSTIKEATRVIKKQEAFCDALIYTIVVGKGAS